MNVAQVEQTASERLEMNLDQYPRLCAAHFVGSNNSMAEKAYFPSYKDVDMHLIFEVGSPALEKQGCDI